MTTFIIVLLAVLVIFVMLGAALTFSMLGGMVAGRAVEWAMGAERSNPASGDSLTPRELAEIDDLIRRTRKAARLPPIN